MANFYRVVKYVNEFLLDIDAENELWQIGAPSVGETIAYSKTLSGAMECLERYFENAIGLNALIDDRIISKAKLKYPKRRLTYRTFNNDGPVRHLVTLVVIETDSILGDCL